MRGRVRIEQRVDDVDKFRELAQRAVAVSTLSIDDPAARSSPRWVEINEPSQTSMTIALRVKLCRAYVKVSVCVCVCVCDCVRACVCESKYGHRMLEDVLEALFWAHQ